MAQATQDPGGACGSGADRGLSGSCGSEDPEGLRPALLLELQRPLLGRGERHQAARAHGMGSGIKEPDPCPGRIKPRRVVLDANRADRTAEPPSIPSPAARVQSSVDRVVAHL